MNATRCPRCAGPLYADGHYGDLTCLTCGGTVYASAPLPLATVFPRGRWAKPARDARRCIDCGGPVSQNAGAEVLRCRPCYYVDLRKARKEVRR